MTDAINHPAHYTSSPAKCECGRTIECIDITEHMSFPLGNTVKYVWRADLKHDDGGLEDLRKAAWYIDREIKRREAANTPDRPTTPEPETSPAKPGPSASQDGLRVGARVRVSYGSIFMPGHEGEIVAEGAPRAGYDWTVKLDKLIQPNEFRTHELEVIGQPENMCAIEGRHTHDGTGTETTHEGPHT